MNLTIEEFVVLYFSLSLCSFEAKRIFVAQETFYGFYIEA